MQRKYEFWLIMMVGFLFGLVMASMGGVVFASTSDAETACGSASDIIKIGVIGPMKSNQGEGHWNGALIAAEEINRTGGIQIGALFKEIELIQADSNELKSTSDAENAMTHLILEDKADFVVGGYRTVAVLEMQKIAARYKTIFLGCGSATLKLCNLVGENYQKYKYWFRVSPPNVNYLLETNFELAAMVIDAVRAEMKTEKPKIALLSEDEPWARWWVDYSQKKFDGMEVEVVGAWWSSKENPYTKSILSEIKEHGVHIIFTGFTGQAGAAFARDVNRSKIPAILTGINVAAEKEGFNEKTDGLGSYVTTYETYCRDVAYNDLTNAFVEEYYKRFGKVPPHFADTYVAIMAMKNAIEKAGDLNTDKVIASLETINMKTPFGRLAFTGNHDAKVDPGYRIGIGVQWQHGEKKGVWSNAPEGMQPKGLVPFKLPPWMVTE